jgi:hypothetical protein
MTILQAIHAEPDSAVMLDCAELRQLDEEDIIKTGAKWLGKARQAELKDSIEAGELRSGFTTKDTAPGVCRVWRNGAWLTA